MNAPNQKEQKNKQMGKTQMHQLMCNTLSFSIEFKPLVTLTNKIRIWLAQCFRRNTYKTILQQSLGSKLLPVFIWTSIDIIFFYLPLNSLSLRLCCKNVVSLALLTLCLDPCHILLLTSFKAKLIIRFIMRSLRLIR